MEGWCIDPNVAVEMDGLFLSLLILPYLCKWGAGGVILAQAARQLPRLTALSSPLDANNTEVFSF